MFRANINKPFKSKISSLAKHSGKKSYDTVYGNLNQFLYMQVIYAESEKEHEFHRIITFFPLFQYFAKFNTNVISINNVNVQNVYRHCSDCRRQRVTFKRSHNWIRVRSDSFSLFSISICVYMPQQYKLAYSYKPISHIDVNVT